MKVLVQNCSEKKIFEVNLESPIFPISGCGIVYREWCSKETSEYPEGDAHLCTDDKRQILFCHNNRCKNYVAH